MLCLDLLWVEILERSLIPFFPLLLELELKIPQLFVRNDIYFDLIKNWILTWHHFKVLLLLVNVIELLTQLFDPLLYLSNAFLEFFGTSCGFSCCKVIDLSVDSF